MPSRTPPPAVRINIPTVNISEAWAPAPLRKQRVLGTRLVRFYLPCVLLLSLVVNIYYITRPAPLALPSTLASTRQDGATGHRGVAEADLGQLTDLVVVPGHGVYLG
ncbi:hypothetical protein IWW54_003688, partial [Coemansia sp. RSA 2705]